MFYEKLAGAWARHNSLVCVGLDPDPRRLAQLGIPEGDYFTFCQAIVDATAPYVAAFKPQFAHFAAFGREGDLEQLLAYIREAYPAHITILDAKRGDIGSTAAFYAREAFERYDADAVTLNPYLGDESVRPFLEYADRGIVVLCRTSNPDSDWLQGTVADGLRLYERVADRVAAWNDNGQCMLVTGATYPAELASIRARVGDLPLLVPGVGAQGGDLAAVLANGLDSQNQGLLVSSSRGIIFAWEATGEAAENYATAAGEAAGRLCEEINQLRAGAPTDTSIA